MKPRKPGESDADYIKRLETSNRDLKARNDQLAKWAEKISEAITHLATEGSLVFQAMAEKAGVRSHPSVTAAVEMFDKIAHPQWHDDDRKIPDVHFPKDWEFDPPDVWSGDADMELNSPVSEAIWELEQISRSCGRATAERIFAVIGRLEGALRKGVQGIKEKHGFKPKHLAVPQKHYRDMSREELIETINVMGWVALDLAQDMAFANEVLRRDLRAAVYRRVCADLYGLSQLPHGPFDDAPNEIGVKVFGKEAVAY